MENIMPHYPHERVVNPIYDEGFKLIFGREGVSEPLLKDLLNSIFADDPVLGNIEQVQFINIEKQNEIKDGRGLRYDIRCLTSTGHHFIVEMQKAEQHHFTERCIYYLSRDISDQGYKGTNENEDNWDFSLTPVVGLFICNFSVRELADQPVVYGRLMDEHSYQPIGDYVRYVFIQLPWFQKSEEDCNLRTDKWIYNIKNMGTTQSVAFRTNDDIFKYLHSVSNVAALDADERNVYEAALMRARDYNAQMKFAEDKAMSIGLAKGIAQGRAEGREEGRAEGRAEGQRDLVKNLLELNVPLSVIASASGLTEDEILHISQQKI